MRSRNRKWRVCETCWRCTIESPSPPWKNDGSPLTRRFDIRRFSNNTVQRNIDTVAVEEPLEIRLGFRVKDALRSETIAVAMRTPGADRELAAGYLLTEGVIRDHRDIADIRYLGAEDQNELLVELVAGVDVDERRLARQGVISSSCGVCGKRSREGLALAAPPLPRTELALSYAAVESFPELLSGRQKGFAQTGGLHAAALMNAEGGLEAEFEDIGRHNALDKLMGDALLRGRIPLTRSVAFLSSRSSFELVQKAAMSGLAMLATIGGPSSLAIEAARDYGMTLVGFVRPGRMNVYSGEWRLHS